MTREGSGSGKLILFGEHAAVYGLPAVGTSLPCRTVLRFNSENIPPNRHQSDRSWPSSRNAIRTEGASRECRNILSKLLDDLGQLDNPKYLPPLGSWQIRSDVPQAGGFGSSGALCVAVARIVLDKPDNQYDREVHILANLLERRFHGTPSGIDTGMSTDNGSALWISSHNQLPKRCAISIPRWHLLYGALPRVSNTANNVSFFRREMESQKPELISAMNELGELSMDFAALAAKKKNNFSQAAARLVNRAQEILTALGLSLPTLNRVLSIAAEEGAIGGKLSGGGSGGAFYLCAPTQAIRDELLKVLPERFAREDISLALNLTPLDFG